MVAAECGLLNYPSISTAMAKSAWQANTHLFKYSASKLKLDSLICWAKHVCWPSWLTTWLNQVCFQVPDKVWPGRSSILYLDCTDNAFSLGLVQSLCSQEWWRKAQQLLACSPWGCFELCCCCSILYVIICGCHWWTRKDDSESEVR